MHLSLYRPPKCDVIPPPPRGHWFLIRVQGASLALLLHSTRWPRQINGGYNMIDIKF